MNLIELQRALRQLRLGGMAAVLEARLRQAQAEPMVPIDLLSTLVSDELTRRSDRLLERRRKHAGFRDPHKTLDNFDFTFNADSEGCRSAFRTDVDHCSEVMPISVPNSCRSVLRL
jgi:DNA replication protein DnaC